MQDNRKPVPAVPAVTKFTPAAPVKQDKRPVKITDPFNVRQTFLQLTHRTCPNGYEHELYADMLHELGFIPDLHGNFHAKVGTPEQQRVVFAAHLDTVGRQIHKVKHVFTEGGRVVGSNGKTILGADDKAGVAILLYMYANKIPGTYMLFVGEEVGCIGSSELAETMQKGQYDAMISFDRAGYKDVITHQASGRTCSDAFGLALATQLNAAQGGFNYAPSPHGVYTDSNEFRGVIPECTNVSVGYFKQHGNSETQDLLWLEALALACTKVDWQALPIERTPEKDFPRWGGYGMGAAAGTYSGFDWDEYDRAKAGASTTSASSYYAARYGITPEDMTISEMTDLVAMGCSDDDFDTWYYNNLEKARTLLLVLMTDYPKAVEAAAEYVELGGSK